MCVSLVQFWRTCWCIGIEIPFVRLVFVFQPVYPYAEFMNLLRLLRLTSVLTLVVAGTQRYNDKWSIALILCTVFRACEEYLGTISTHVRLHKLAFFRTSKCHFCSQRDGSSTAIHTVLPADDSHIILLAHIELYDEQYPMETRRLGIMYSCMHSLRICGIC